MESSVAALELSISCITRRNAVNPAGLLHCYFFFFAFFFFAFFFAIIFSFRQINSFICMLISKFYD